MELDGHAELVVARGNREPVAERLLDLEGLVVPGLGVVEGAAQLGDHFKLVVGLGHAGTVAERLPYPERLAVPGLGVVKGATLLRLYFKLVVHSGAAALSLFRCGGGVQRLQDLRVGALGPLGSPASPTILAASPFA